MGKSSPSQVKAATVGKPQEGGDIVARPYSQGVLLDYNNHSLVINEG